MENLLRIVAHRQQPLHLKCMSRNNQGRIYLKTGILQVQNNSNINNVFLHSTE